MTHLYEKSLLKLELNQILLMLSECAGSANGKQACLDLVPSTDCDIVRDLLDETSAASELGTRKGNPGFSGVVDVTASVERAEMGGCLQPKELLEIAGLLRCSRNINGYVSPDDKPTVLDPLFRMVAPNKRLEDKIFGAIISEDQIADTASSTLADIRRHMRIQSGKIKDSLQKMISSTAYAKFLRDPIITIRQGRYVVPVKSEHKNDIPGMVHDVSSSGSTYFIEPMSAVNANNALRELELQEQKEIERILMQLTAEVATFGHELLDNFRILVQLDVIFAKARLAYKMRAWAPAINDQGIVELRKARHPLIDPAKVVPITLRLGSDFDTMIITGPNTGGKTVTLKTVGLLTLMAECGLHIPAGEGSTISTFDAILADIGDEQSIAQSLSTFSSHMRTIVDLVDQCDHRTLVLFDELGAGTDPAEGAALAIALIEFCRKTGSKVIATTHYAELKLYAMRTNGVVNASCEFDVETLQPTYKLLIGIPGKSNAFAICRRLGLSEEILKEAVDLVGKNDRDFEDVLSQLESQRQQMEAARLEAETLRRQTEKIKLESEEYSIQIQKEKAQLRRDLNEAESKLRTEQPVKQRQAPSRDVMVGDTVELLKLGTKASVIAINKDGTYQLQAGIMKLTVKPDEVYLLENENPYKQKGGRPAHSGREMKLAAMPSEVDLRGMDSIEAVCVMERYLDEAMRANVSPVRVIHGKGTGTLRSAVHNALRKNKFIKKFRLGVYGEGEDGVTIVEFR